MTHTVLPSLRQWTQEDRALSHTGLHDTLLKARWVESGTGKERGREGGEREQGTKMLNVRSSLVRLCLSKHF